jgi:hypothetical protein
MDGRDHHWLVDFAKFIPVVLGLSPYQQQYYILPELLLGQVKLPMRLCHYHICSPLHKVVARSSKTFSHSTIDAKLLHVFAW